MTNCAMPCGRLLLGRPRHHRVDADVGCWSGSPASPDVLARAAGRRARRRRRLPRRRHQGGDATAARRADDTPAWRPQDFELPGLTVPAGTIVFPYITLVHRRPDLWEDPHRVPSRSGSSTHAVNAYAWIPFGGGAQTAAWAPRSPSSKLAWCSGRSCATPISRPTRAGPNASAGATYSSYPPGAAPSDSTAT